MSSVKNIFVVKCQSSTACHFSFFEKVVRFLSEYNFDVKTSNFKADKMRKKYQKKIRLCRLCLRIVGSYKSVFQIDLREPDILDCIKLFLPEMVCFVSLPF